MNEIKAGDLVQVVRCCCVAYVDMTATFVVTRLNRPSLRDHCGTCKTVLPDEPFAMATDNAGEGGIPVSWLKRIPPLGELDDVRHDEEITA